MMRSKLKPAAHLHSAVLAVALGVSALVGSGVPPASWRR